MIRLYPAKSGGDEGGENWNRETYEKLGQRGKSRSGRGNCPLCPIANDSPCLG